MPRATIELDVLLRQPNPSNAAFWQIEEDDEWCRVLSAEPRTNTKPSQVFAELHDTLLAVQYPLATDPCEIEGRLETARAAIRDWAGRALAGQAQITLDGVDCWMLFQLTRIISDVSLAAVAPEWAAWMMETVDPMRPEIEPAPVRVAV